MMQTKGTLTIVHAKNLQIVSPAAFMVTARFCSGIVYVTDDLYSV